MPAIEIAAHDVISPSFSAGLSAQQQRFVHVAGGWSAAPNVGIGMGCWWDTGGLDYAWISSPGIPFLDGAVIRVGGSCPLAGTKLAGNTLLPFVGDIDELRLTAHLRFGFTNSVFTAQIPAAALQTPFPNY